MEMDHGNMWELSTAAFFCCESKGSGGSDPVVFNKIRTAWPSVAALGLGFFRQCINPTLGAHWPHIKPHAKPHVKDQPLGSQKAVANSCFLESMNPNKHILMIFML